MFGFDYNVYCAEIMCFKDILVKTSDIRYSEARAQKVAVT